MRIIAYLNMRSFLKQFKLFVSVNKVLKDLIDLVYSSIFCLLLYLIPNKLSHMLSVEGRGIPQHMNKILNNNKIYDDWVFDHKIFIIVDEINIIINQDVILDNIINTEIPSFFINSRKIPQDKFTQAYGATADANDYKTMYGLGVSPIFYTGKFDDKFKILNLKAHLQNGKSLIGNKLADFHLKSGAKFNCKDSVSSGSAINSIVSLSRIANKTNVYGWDSYLKKNISSMSNVGALLALMSRPNNNIKRFKYIAPNIFNYVYSYKIKSSCDNINIHGKLSGIKKHHYLVKKLEKLIYI